MLGSKLPALCIWATFSPGGKCKFDTPVLGCTQLTWRVLTQSHKPHCYLAWTENTSPSTQPPIPGSYALQATVREKLSFKETCPSLLIFPLKNPSCTSKKLWGSSLQGSRKISEGMFCLGWRIKGTHTQRHPCNYFYFLQPHRNKKACFLVSPDWKDESLLHPALEPDAVRSSRRTITITKLSNGNGFTDTPHDLSSSRASKARGSVISLSLSSQPSNSSTPGLSVPGIPGLSPRRCSFSGWSTCRASFPSPLGKPAQTNPD